MTLQKAILSGGLSNKTVPSRGYRSISEGAMITASGADTVGIKTQVTLTIFRAPEQTLGITAAAVGRSYGTIMAAAVQGLILDARTAAGGILNPVSVRQGLTLDTSVHLARSFVNLIKHTFRVFRFKDNSLRHRFKTIGRTTRYRT